MKSSRRFRYALVVLLVIFAAYVFVDPPASAGQVPSPTVGVSPTTVGSGSTFTVTVANGPGNRLDWVTLTPATGPDGPYIAWKYLNGSSTPPTVGLTSATVTFIAPATGTYNVRLFANDSWTKLATSADIAVSPVIQNYVPKYAADGTLVTSAISESSGTLDVAGISGGSGIRITNKDLSPTRAWLFYPTTNGSNTDLRLWEYGTPNDDRVTFQAGGNVGIGTTSPTSKLHVAGDVRVDGNIAAKYQDVAEWVDSVEPLEAGTIVVIDDSTDNRVTAAAQPYDFRVAGAISASPGVVLGEPGSGRVLVAQSGRVRIKADASYGAIHAGDLLVSSPTKGAAMRSEPVDVGGVKMHRPGTLIGKALEPLDEGIGEILVLLTLQ